MLHDILRHDHIQWHPQWIRHKFANLLPNWTLSSILTLLPNFGGFQRTLQRVRLANRGRLLVRTPGPVPFWTCICSNFEHLQRVWHASRGRLLLRIPGPVLLGLAYVLLVETNPFPNLSLFYRTMLFEYFLDFAWDHSFLNLSCLRTFWVSNIPRYFYFALACLCDFIYVFSVVSGVWHSTHSYLLPFLFILCDKIPVSTVELPKRLISNVPWHILAREACF